MTINEVAPPGFGHTKSGKGDKKGGTAAAFDKARKEGRFKGSKSDMFAIMWSQKKKGDKPHYKPGTDKKYKKYQEEGVERFDKLVKTIKNTPDLSKEKTAKLLKVAGKVRGIPEEVSRRRKPSAIKRNVIPLLGKNIQSNLMKKLVSSKVKKIYIALDNDAIKQALKFCEELLNEGKKVYLVELPGKDPSEMGFEQFTKLIQKATPLNQFSLMEKKIMLI